MAALLLLRVGPGEVVGPEEGDVMTSEPGSPALTFEVGVAIMGTVEDVTMPADRDDKRGQVLPGYDDASGLKPFGRYAADRVLVKGEEAAKVATEAIAGQIGLAAQRIAAVIESQAVAAPQPGELGLDSVEVSFGITLTGGIQALFTAQAASSAQVNITLTRRPATGS